MANMLIDFRVTLPKEQENEQNKYRWLRDLTEMTVKQVKSALLSGQSKDVHFRKPQCPSVTLLTV